MKEPRWWAYVRTTQQPGQYYGRQVHLAKILIVGTKEQQELQDALAQWPVTIEWQAVS